MSTTYHPDDDVDTFGPRLWDADPDVCCAAFQLGACPHTEDYDPYDYDVDGPVASDPQPVAPDVPEDDEPF